LHIVRVQYKGKGDGIYLYSTLVLIMSYLFLGAQVWHV